MTGLLGPSGKPISSSDHASSPSFFKKGAPPVMGEAFGPWAGRDMQYMNMPGGGVVQFDLSKLTLADYRQMAPHYQVNSSLSVLMFMLHQLDWHIECDNKKIAAHVEENLHMVWTRLVRAMSQSFWAGYSPNILQWENDVNGKRVMLTKIKDLVPEEARVNWKLVDGATSPGHESSVAPKIRVYDGIKQSGVSGPIPSVNTLWYPLLMENGDYNGRKLLKSAFQPWFFSTLMHLFSNRYFERFGEPVPVGRAPFDDGVKVPGVADEVSGNQYMASVLQAIRSRSVVVLPSDRAMDSSGSPTDKYEYEIEYLESQMRGADFERYMMRLDEEISLSLFTPLLLMRAADSGSYNLGVSHMQMYLWQLNALAGDWAEYINKYILAPMANYNFGPNSPRPEIVFHKMGKTQTETTRAVLSALVQKDLVKVDLRDLGQATGMNLEEIKIATEPAAAPASDATDAAGVPVLDPKTGKPKGGDNPASVADKITLRIQGQAERAFSKGTFGSGWVPDFGFAAHVDADRLEKLRVWNDDLLSPGMFDTSAEYLAVFSNGAHDIIES